MSNIRSWRMRKMLVKGSDILLGTRTAKPRQRTMLDSLSQYSPAGASKIHKVLQSVPHARLRKQQQP